MSSDVTAIFHSVLDNNRALATPIGTIERSPYHLFIGSTNIAYAGTKEMNEALKDRFALIRLPHGDFKSIISKSTGVSTKHILLFLEQVYKAIKNLVSTTAQGRAAHTIRGYIDAANYLQEYGCNNVTKTEVLEDYIINKIEDFDEMMAVRQAIRDAAWKDFPVSEEEDLYVNGGI